MRIISFLHELSTGLAKGCLIMILGLFGLWLLWNIGSCIYFEMSHLDETELEWADAYTYPDSAFFRSDKGNIARLTVTEKKIRNSKIPFGFNHVTSTSYDASIDFDFKVDKMEGFFSLIKSAEDNSIELRLNLNYLYFMRRDYNPRTFALNGVTYDNCYSQQIHRQKQR